MLRIRVLILALLGLLILFPPVVTNGLTIIQVSTSSELNISEDTNAVSGVDKKGDIRKTSTSEELVEVTNNFQNSVIQEVNLEKGIGWSIVSSSQRNVIPGNSEVYNVDTTQVDSSISKGNYTLISRSGSFNLSSQRQVRIIESNVVLDASPSTVGSSSTHTWKLPNYVTPIDNGNKTEIDTFLIDYSGSDANFSGLTNQDITVTVTRQLSGGPDRSTISVNSDSYSNQQAIIDLSGAENTQVVDDSNNPNVKIEIQGIQNPTSEGSFNPTITSNLNNTVSESFNAQLDISSDPFFLSEITSTPENITEGGTIGTNYNITNTGVGKGTQDIVFKVNNNEISRDSSITLDSDQSELGSFSYTDNDESIRADVSVETDNDSSTRTVQIVDKFKLTTNTSIRDNTALHTWEASNSTIGGDVDTITVDYPSGSGFNLDGLNETDITVKVLNPGQSNPSDISINQDDYTGSTATFDLSGIFDTEVDGVIIVKIDGIKNAGSTGAYQPTITLDNGSSTVSDSAEIDIN
jgi:hypothetical protein